MALSPRFLTLGRYHGVSGPRRDTIPYTSNQGHAQIYTHEYLRTPNIFRISWRRHSTYHSNETIRVKFPRAEVSQTLLTSGTPRNTCNRAETNPYSTRPTPRAPNMYLARWLPLYVERVVWSGSTYIHVARRRGGGQFSHMNTCSVALSPHTYNTTPTTPKPQPLLYPPISTCS